MSDFDWTEFLQNTQKAFEGLMTALAIWAESASITVQSAAQFLITGLAYPLMDGNALAFTRFLAVFMIAMALKASGYRHWTLRAGLGILMFFLGMDALLGLAPGRVQNLTVAILGRNTAIYLVCFGLAFFPSTRTAAKKRAELDKRPRARQVVLASKYEEKGEL